MIVEHRVQRNIKKDVIMQRLLPYVYGIIIIFLVGTVPTVNYCYAITIDNKTPFCLSVTLTYNTTPLCSPEIHTIPGSSKVHIMTGACCAEYITIAHHQDNEQHHTPLVVPFRSYTQKIVCRDYYLTIQEDSCV